MTEEDKHFVGSVDLIIKALAVLLGIFVLMAGMYFSAIEQPAVVGQPRTEVKWREQYWRPPDGLQLAAHPDGGKIRYGRELIAHTSKYLGPRGSVAHVSNGMNCQNCHLDAGTRIFGNNYSAVAATYPKFRARSGSIEGFEKRINDCFQRSLNGIGLPPGSKEMQAMVAYLKWLGEGVAPNTRPAGVGLVSLTFLERPADPVRGAKAYEALCTQCHGHDGAGKLNDAGNEWQYPPLWGPDSYNVGAGLFRLSKFAAYVKANMPYGVSFEKPLLSDEQCWDIAAFVNSQPRPVMDLSGDWPDVSQKPFDHPFGPYDDELNERQHKFGPFAQGFNK